MEESRIVQFLSGITGNILSHKTLKYAVIITIILLGSYALYLFSTSISRISPQKNTKIELIPSQAKEYKNYQ